MTRLQSELQRLYGLPGHEPGSGSLVLVGADGAVRTLLLGAVGPAAWDALAVAWRGVQADLELPSPAIAVNGVDGYQLWFSLAQAVPLARGAEFLDGLRRKYLGAVAADRLRLRPGVAAETRHVDPVPQPQPGTGSWSAFLAQDLAPLFAEEPWLDLSPGDDAQAELLVRHKSIQPRDFEAALLRLAAAEPAPPMAPGGPAHAAGQAPSPVAATAPSLGAAARSATSTDLDDPRRFLLGVMNDAGVDLRHRIEAAKALLPYTAAGGPVAH